VQFDRAAPNGQLRPDPEQNLNLGELELNLGELELNLGELELNLGGVSSNRSSNSTSVG